MNVGKVVKAVDMCIDVAWQQFITLAYATNKQDSGLQCATCKEELHRQSSLYHRLIAAAVHVSLFSTFERQVLIGAGAVAAVYSSASKSPISSFVSFYQEHASSLNIPWSALLHRSSLAIPLPASPELLHPGFT